MKISSPRFSKYLTADALEYSYAIVNRCRERQPPMSPTEPQVNAVQEAAEALNANFKRELSDPYSKNMSGLDNVRDRLIMGTRTIAEGYTYHFDPATAAKAELILSTIDKYGSQIARLPYEAETTTLASLTNDLMGTPKMAEAIRDLGLDTWIIQLKTVNDQFRQTFSARVGSQTDAQRKTTNELRQKLHDALRTLFAHLTAHATLSNDASVTAIIGDINGLTDRFNQLTDRRLNKPSEN